MKTQIKIFYTSVLFLIYIFSISNTLLSQPVTEWVQRYNSPGNYDDDLIDMVIDKEGNTYITGNTGNPLDIVTLKYSSSGAECIAIDKLNNTYITGSSDYNTPYKRFLTVKYDSAGNFIWTANYLNILFFNHYGKRVLIDSTNSVFVGGTSYGPESGSNDIVLIKYSQTTNVESVSNLIPEKMELFQNYPNPFNPETKINYELPNDVLVKIIIYDALGREVKILLNEFKIAGRYNVAFKGNDLPSGVYYYRFSAEGEAGNFMQTKKMLLLK